MDPDDVVLHVDVPPGPCEPYLSPDLVEGRVIARPETARVIDEDDMLRAGIGEDRRKFLDDGCVRFAPGGHAPGVMTVEPEQRRARQAPDDFGKQATAITVQDGDVSFTAEASHRMFVQTVIKFDREDPSEVPLLGVDHVAPIRPGLDEVVASESLGMIRDDRPFGRRRRWRRPPAAVPGSQFLRGSAPFHRPRPERLDRTRRGIGSTPEPTAGPTNEARCPSGHREPSKERLQSAVGQFNVPSHAGRPSSVRTRRDGRPHTTADGPPARAMSLVPR